MVGPLPTAPDPAIRVVWILRGFILTILLLPLGWVPLVALAYGISYLGVPVLASFAMASILLIAAVAASIVGWAFLTYDRISFALGDQSVRIRWGILFQRDAFIPYSSLDDVVIVRGPILRMFQIATVRLRLRSTPKGGPAWGEPQLVGVPDAQAVVDHITQRMGARPARPPPTPIAARPTWQPARPPRSGL